MPMEGHRPLRSRLAALAELPVGQSRATPVEPTFFQRYECKYLVSPRRVPELRSYLQPFCRPDSFAALRATHRYAVCSLYLDTLDLALYRQTANGEKNRFKLRVRTYSDDPAEPVYLEIKQKVDSIVHKRRVGLGRQQAHKLLHDGDAGVFEALSGRKRVDAEHFAHYVERIAARPVLRVKYVREAYEATGHEPVRVTLDSQVMHAVTLDQELGHEAGRWVPTPVEGTILEIKFTERFPGWVEDLVRQFELRQRSVPKYVLSIEHAFQNGRGAVPPLEPLPGPPGS